MLFPPLSFIMESRLKLNRMVTIPKDDKCVYKAKGVADEGIGKV
jgi:hypothetical protein